MKYIYISILFTLFIFNTSFSFSQEIECKEMEFSFNSDAEQIEEIGLKVKLLLEVDKLKNDTIILKTNVRMPLFGPKNIKAYIINKDGTSYPLKSWIDDQINTEQSENLQLLKVVTPNKRRASVEITYNVFGSIRYGSENDDFYSSQQSYEYYYPMNIPIRKVKVSLPENTKYFLSYEKEKKEIKDINLSFINKEKYIQKSIAKGNLTINLHIPDSLTANKKMQQNITQMQQYTERLATYLSSPKSADIIYINWRDDKERRAFGEAVGNHAICDINFDSKDLLHELIHILLPVNVEQDSKGEYFMRESIIEWLALSLADKSPYERVNSINDSINLYNASINNYTTWNLIYTIGPSIIQQLSSKCGEERMVDMIISFLKKNQNKMTSYDKFIAYVKKHLSNDLGEEMDYLIKTSY